MISGSPPPREPQPGQVPLRRLAALSGVSELELSAVWGEDARPCETFLLGKLLLSGQVAHLVAAIGAVGTSSVRLLAVWADEQAALGPVEGIALQGGLSSCARSELRRVIERSLEPLMDAECARRLARLGFLRLRDWSADEFERSLDAGDEMGDGLLSRVVHWFLSGLAQQVAQLNEGIGQLLALQSVLFPEASLPQPSVCLLALLSMSDAALCCLRAAAPLAARGCSWQEDIEEDDRMAALLCLRALDWAFRRIENDRPEVILRLQWRAGCCRLLWDFLAAEDLGFPVTTCGLFNPDDAGRAFAVKCVLPKLRASSVAARAANAAEACADAESAAELTPNAAAEPDVDADAPSQEKKKRRPRRRRGGCEVEEAAREEAEEAEQDDERDEESEAARREWGRLSVRMMLEMGWRADTGEVGPVRLASGP